MCWHPWRQCDCDGNNSTPRVCGGNYTEDADADGVCDDVDPVSAARRTVAPTTTKTDFATLKKLWNAYSGAELRSKRHDGQWHMHRSLRGRLER